MKQQVQNILLCSLSVILSVFSVLCFIELILPRPEPEYRDLDYDNGFELCSIEEFDNYIKENNILLPQNFVTADMLDFLGSFEKIRFIDGSNFINYCYTLKHESGKTISFTVYEIPWSGIDKVTESDNGNPNLNYKDSRFRYHDTGILRHIYLGNRLYCIEWTANGVWYQITAKNLHVNETLNKLRSNDPIEQQEALDLFSDFIGDADSPAIVTMKTKLKTAIPTLSIFILVTAAAVVCWRFVKVTQPVSREYYIKL